MSHYPVTKLDEVYLACNPDEALKPGDARYVDLNAVRGGDNMYRDIGWKIKVSAGRECLNKLVTGHRGCGKTTELFCLKAKLEEDRMFVVYIDIEDVLDIGDVSYLDVLLAIARSLSESLDKASIDIDDALLKKMESWFSETIMTSSREAGHGATINAEAKVGGSLPGILSLFTKATANVKSSGSRRIEIREKLNQDLSQFLYYLRTFIQAAVEAVQQSNYADIVLIVDGLEKVVYVEKDGDTSNYFELFVHHADQLKAPGCHIIYTVPISMAFKAQLGDAWPDGVYVIPMVKYATEEGKRALREVVQKRLDIDSVFESPAAVGEFIALSGGAIRDLLRLIRMSCGPQERIGEADTQHAIKTFLREYDRLIREKDVERLRKVARDKRVPNASEFEWLLHHRLIHEYQNGDRWADLHPAVKNRLSIEG